MQVVDTQRPVLGSSLAQFSRMVGDDAIERIATASVVPEPAVTLERVISACAPLTRLMPQVTSAWGASVMTRFDSVTAFAPSTVTAAVDASASPRERAKANPSSVVGVVTAIGNSTPRAFCVWIVTSGPPAEP